MLNAIIPAAAPADRSLLSRIKPSVFGKIMIPMTLLVVCCVAAMLWLRINKQKQTLFSAVEARGDTLAGSLGKVFADSLYVDDFETVISHALNILAANTDLHSIIVSTHEDTVTLQDGHYEFSMDQTPAAPATGQRLHVIREVLIKDSLELGQCEIWLRLDEYDQQVASMYRTAFFELAVCALMVLAACWFIARRLTHPIRSLEQVMSRMAAGERSARAAVNSSDEIGRMAVAMNSMLDVLQRAEISLVHANQTLETRVRDRTAELRIANDRMTEEIEHRKEIERDLRRSEERYDLAVNGVNDGIWDWDIESFPEGDQMYQSARFKQLLGYDVDDILEPYDQWTHPQDLPSVREAIQSHLQNRTDGLNVEYRGLTRSGEVRWFRSRGQCVRRPDGKAIRMAGSLTDITEQKQSEQRMSNLHQEMLSLSRQAGMAEIASGVLHNVGNVLNSVCVSATTVAQTLQASRVGQLSEIAGMLRAHGDDLTSFLTGDDRGKHIPKYLITLSEKLLLEREIATEHVDRISDKLEHIKEIVSRQQEYARVGGFDELLDLQEVIEDAIKINQATLDRNAVELVRDYGPVPQIKVDKHKLLQILVNLLGNARSAVEANGKPSKRIVIRLSQDDGDHVSISISDNGVGIAAEHSASIFSHGFTTKKDGHGFGLHSCALAADDLGGKIDFNSPGAGQGATFTVTLPLHEELAGANASIP